MEISVSDPEKHGTSTVNAFVDFRIRTTTKLPQFAADDFFVRRRYRDFVWLRQQLTSGFPGAIVPPLPDADTTLLLGEDRFADAFIERRQAGLELFLRRVACHAHLSTSSELQTFLEARVWELQTLQNASGSGWLSAIYDGTEASFKRLSLSFRHKVEDEDVVERLRQHANNYSTLMGTAAAKHHAGVSALEEAAADLGQLGPSFALLSQSEAELSQPCADMAQGLDALSEHFRRHVQAEHVSGLASLLALNAGMAVGLTEVLANRDAALIHYQRSSNALETRAAESRRWQAGRDGAQGGGGSAGGGSAGGGSTSGGSPSGGVGGALSGAVSGAVGGAVSGAVGGFLSRLQEASSLQELLYDDPDLGDRMSERVAEAERELSVATHKWDAISTQIHAEASAFHTSTRADFASGLCEHARRQLDFERQQQKHWQRILDAFVRIETPSGSRPQPERRSPLDAD